MKACRKKNYSTFVHKKPSLTQVKQELKYLRAGLCSVYAM